MARARYLQHNQGVAGNDASDGVSDASAAGRIVVYDGYCHLCSGGVRFFERFRVTPPFLLLPTQGPQGQELLARHHIDPDDPSTFLVLDRGRIYTASDASIHMMMALGGAWRLVRLARIVPRAWRDAAYRLLARNRYRWFGRRTSCYVPTDRS
jgi:predicted DCC family thiol-disulfide oxidoreductase YuxK